MNHLRQHFPVWATIVDVDIASSLVSEDGLNQGMQQVIDFCKQVDTDFSTYIDTSWVTRLRTHQVEISSCPPSVQEVWQLCLQAKHLTDGAFDPWAVEGGFDPSGLVQGWAADKCADLLVTLGIEHVQVNAAGDLALRGGWFDSENLQIKPWSIGVVNPENKVEVVKVFEITDGAIATSGTYERGAHICDPHSGMIAIGAKSATVVGPNGWLCDAMATAVMVSGTDGAKYFSQEQLHGYEVYAVDRHEQTAWEI
jgi:thiamine biosynthesis lipoprotein